MPPFMFAAGLQGLQQVDLVPCFGRLHALDAYMSWMLGPLCRTFKVLPNFNRW